MRKKKDKTEEEKALEPAAQEEGEGKPEAARDEVAAEKPAQKVEIEAGELEELRRRKEEYDQVVDQLKRVMADFQNYRKRVDRDRESSGKTAIRNLISELLPVFDDLDRAVAAVNSCKSPEDMAAGIRLIEAHLAKVLNGYGVERIHCLMEPFDPACHEAVEVDEAQQHPEPIVLKEYQRGYRFGGHVIKPAKVRVSSKAPAAEEETAEKDTLEGHEEN